MTNPFIEIENGIIAALGPMLKSQGGYLEGIEAFHGDLTQWIKHVQGRKPRAFVAINGEFQMQAAARRLEDLRVTMAVNFLDDTERGTRAQVAGSGVSGEAPGIYQMLADGMIGLDGLVLQIGGEATLPASVRSGSVEIDVGGEGLSSGSLFVDIAIPAAEITASVRFKSVRM